MSSESGKTIWYEQAYIGTYVYPHPLCISKAVQIGVCSDTMQGSQRDWKTWKMKMVMERSWNMKNWPKVLEFCDSVIELYQFCPQFVLNLYFFGHH